jgi:hypothetical protein
MEVNVAVFEDRLERDDKGDNETAGETDGTVEP